MINKIPYSGRTDNPAGRNLQPDCSPAARFQTTKSNGLIDFLMKLLNTFASIVSPLKDPNQRK